jgi:hypothetical protein
LSSSHHAFPRFDARFVRPGHWLYERIRAEVLAQR